MDSQGPAWLATVTELINYVHTFSSAERQFAIKALRDAAQQQQAQAGHAMSDDMYQQRAKAAALLGKLSQIVEAL